MDKGAQEKVADHLEQMKKLVDQIRQSNDPMLLALGQMITLGLRETYDTFEGVYQKLLAENEIADKIAQVLEELDTRLSRLEKAPDEENVELEKLRKKLRVQETKLKRHTPMLEFLEEWVDAQRRHYIGENP
jgi:hypothetical protein